MNNQSEIIVVGAGVAGLTAARDLLRRGRKITILEARNRVGGRIFSLEQRGFFLEGGPDFIHGGPLTMELLKEYRILFTPVNGKMIQLDGGKQAREDPFDEGWDELLDAMKSLEQDLPFADFLATRFGQAKYEGLRASAARYAEGFDLVDIHAASTIALYKEWSHEAERQYRIPGGYAQITDALYAECKGLGARILLNKLVTRIEWKKDEVTVTTENGDRFNAFQLLITVPAGIWHLPEKANGGIRFIPAIPEKFAAAAAIGFGTVTKILTEWKRPFWEAYANQAGFMFGNATVPTWWTHYPEAELLLTGWMGGPNSKAYQNNTDEEILELGLQSLSSLFSMDKDALKEELVTATVFNWMKDPYSRGAYSFPSAPDFRANEKFREPVQDTLFFAGEACYSGPFYGTVEAAINSAMAVVPGLLDAGFAVGTKNK